MATGPAAGDIAPGQLLADRYEVRRVLGVGGEGVVVEAVDTRHDRRVAVKVRRVGADGPTDSLLNEARALLSLSPHPALPTVREDVLADDSYLLVMDWVDGVDLQKVLTDGPIRPGRAFVLLSQVASALDHLHAHGLVHGDVKPANILQLPGDRAQLVDLGMAAASLTDGSPGFTAPERGEVSVATAAGDIFAFAATAVALLTGESPTPLDEGAQAASVPDALLPAFCPSLSAGLARNPEERPPSAATLLRALQQSAPSLIDDVPPTFLMTDIVGSTRKWEDQPTAMSAALEAHDRRIADVVSGHGGEVLHSKGEGDSTVSRFADVADALEAAAEMQRTLTDWDEGIALRLSVRAAVHAGPVEERDGNVYGPTLNQAARLRSAGHGGQVLVSEVAARLLGDRLPADLSLIPMGLHRIRDLSRPEPVYQLAGRSLQASFQPLKTLDRLTNLPLLSDELIGRDEELAAVADLLASSRMVTLTGGGGSGKTRLAMQAAAESLGRFPGGVWFVALSSVSDPVGVPRAVLEAIGVTGGTTDPQALMAEALRGEASLLVFDNCEHLLDRVATLAYGLLTSVPGVTILATSRERLRIESETTYLVPVLALPTDDRDATASPAVQLFVRRAAQARPGFTVEGPVGERTLAAITELCRRLDGIPLAIELAASRVSAIAPEKLAGSLADRFRLASGGSRSALPRHQSLHATIEWSESLLPDSARQAWRRVSVFRDGFSLEGATALVCGSNLPSDELASIDEFDLIEALTLLVDASILSVDDSGRYRLLETLREYGAEKLQEAGEETVIMQRLVHWLDQVCDGGLYALADHDRSAASLDVLGREHTNLITALGWAFDHEPLLGTLLVLHSWLHFYTTSRWSEARPYLERAMESLDQLGERDQAALMLCAAHVFAYGGAVERAVELLGPGLERAKAVGEPLLEWIGLCIMGSGTRAATGDRETYQICMAQAVEIADRLGYGYLQAASRLWSSWELFGEQRDEYVEWAARWAEENDHFFLRRQVEESMTWFVRDRAERTRRLERRVAEDAEMGSFGIWTEGMLADEYLGDGQYERAVDLLTTALRRNASSHAGAMRKNWQLLCTCYVRLGLVEQAEDAWAQAQRYPQGLYWVGYDALADLEIGRLESARESLSEVVARSQEFSELDDHGDFSDLNANYTLALGASYLVQSGGDIELAAELISHAVTDPDGWDVDGYQRIAASIVASGGTIPPPTRTLPELLELLKTTLGLSDEVSTDPSAP